MEYRETTPNGEAIVHKVNANTIHVYMRCGKSRYLYVCPVGCNPNSWVVCIPDWQISKACFYLMPSDVAHLIEQWRKIQ